MTDAPAAAPSPKFKHTRELVRLALDDGMTQDEIRLLCRVQQSVVSGWATGKSKARESVLEPLLKRYAHRLNRTTSRFYLVQEEPTPPWEETAEARLIARLTEDAEAYAAERLDAEAMHELVLRHVQRRLKPEYRETRRERGGPIPPPPTPTPIDDDGNPLDEAYEPISDADLLAAMKRIDWTQSAPVADAWAALNAALPRPVPRHWDRLNLDAVEREYQSLYRARFVRYVRLEGAVLWRHTLGTPRVVFRREGRTAERKDIVLDPVGRWIVQAAGKGTFRLIVQSVRQLTGADGLEWAGAWEGTGQHVRADDDAARWSSTLHGPFDVPALVAEVERRLPGAGPHDRAVVPFSLRKALVEHGHPVADVAFVAST
ncbi:MAG: hypothetical protein V4850_32910 [Myxococcota bacterium]